MLLILSFSVASTGSASTSNPDWLASELGRTRGSTAQGICHAERLFIGTVVASSPEKKFESLGAVSRWIIESTLTMQVDHDYQGVPGETIDLTVRGGRVQGFVHSSSAGYPTPEVGSRYLIGLTTTRQASASHPKGAPVYTAVVRLADDLPCPAVRACQTPWASFGRGTASRSREREARAEDDVDLVEMEVDVRVEVGRSRRRRGETAEAQRYSSPVSSSARIAA